MNNANEIEALIKWNSRLLPKEPSEKFAALVLGEDPAKAARTIKSEWFNKATLTKSGFFHEDPSAMTFYSVETLTGRELLAYNINDTDIDDFEDDMASAWHFLETDCYDKNWWIKEYKEYSEGSPYVLVFVKRKIMW